MIMNLINASKYHTLWKSTEVTGTLPYLVPLLNIRSRIFLYIANCLQIQRLAQDFMSFDASNYILSYYYHI